MDIPLAGARADEATSFEPVGKQAQAIAIPPEQFDKIRVLPASQHQLQCCNRDVATDTNASLAADDLDVPRRRGCSFLRAWLYRSRLCKHWQIPGLGVSDLVQRQRVDAVAQAGGQRAVGEDVAEVGVADGAGGFDALHAVAGV